MNTNSKEVIIASFKKKEGNKPWQNLLKTYKEEILELLQTGYNSTHIKEYVEKETGLTLPIQNFRQALYTFKKSLKEEPREKKFLKQRTEQPVKREKPVLTAREIDPVKVAEQKARKLFE